tara:strand:+ start:13615 stop:14124 length:510 start_codon:yes stop_codon:yes gene_type:complete
MEFKTFIETSLNDLYDSTVAAFPNTTMRQHATDPIVITHLKWVPYVGMKTLFVKGLAQNESREYNPTIVFKQVEYNPNTHFIKLVSNDDKIYHLKQLSLENNDVLVRCNCPDFFWRFNYYDHVDKSLYNRKRKKYESAGGPPANPLEMPGMCKHLIKMVKTLHRSSILA